MFSKMLQEPGRGNISSLQIKNCFVRLWNFTGERNNVGCVVVSDQKQRNVFVH